MTPDRTRIIIFPAYSTDNGRISVWDRRTGQRVEVVAGSDGADAVSRLSTSEPHRIALSPDGRYLVIVRTNIRVWDLTNLPANLDDRAPTYRWQGADARFAEVRFVDNTTIETKDYYDTIQRWNILTGEELP
ncbi:hypothetical protein HC928_21405 [bacterium]|nr:hypothetical protein [bacterium]